MALRAPRKPTDRLDEAIGFVGFFAVMMTAVTILCEVTGRPALGWAMVLLGLVVFEGVLWRRRTVLRWRATADLEARGSSAPPVAAAGGRFRSAPAGAVPARSAADRTDAPGC